LIEASESRLISPLDFNLKDRTGDSCLSLAMSRGYYIESELKDKEQFLKNRSELLDLLLPRTNLAFCIKYKINNPLHWCLFNGDVQCGMKIFNEQPMMLMERNYKHDFPFDIFFRKEIRRNYYEESIKLMRKLIIGFSKIIYDFYNATPTQESEFLNTSDYRSKKFYKFMKNLKDVLHQNLEANQALIQEHEGYSHYYKDARFKKPFI
jgi:ankyrin repeat protein